nr:MAG TPA: hypothetical protein [Caudoviricetes sp.]
MNISLCLFIYYCFSMICLSVIHLSDCRIN